MSMRVKPLILLGTCLLLAIALSACQESVDSPEDNGASPDSGQAPSETGGEIVEGNDMTDSGPDRLSLEEAVEAARKDLAGREGKAQDEIELLRAREVTFADGALGCPEEGMMYTQALVEGYYILLRSGGKDYAYHAGRDGEPFHCPADRSKAPPKDSGQDDNLS